MIRVIPVSFEEDPHFCVSFEEDPHFCVDFDNLTILERSADVDVFVGDVAITPSDSVQILQTKDKMMTENVLVNPIPSNYGKIGWDGFKMTVS